MSETVYWRCCRMDARKDRVVAACRRPMGRREPRCERPIAHFEMTWRVRGRLKLLKVTDIAMEVDGGVLRPVWNVLENRGFRLLLVNPAQVKALQGRKSDSRDARRIAEYSHYGRLDPHEFFDPKDGESRSEQKKIMRDMEAPQTANQSNIEEGMKLLE